MTTSNITPSEKKTRNKKRSKITSSESTPVKKRGTKKHKADLKMINTIVEMVENIKTGDGALVQPKVLSDDDKKFVRVVKKDGSFRLVEKKSP